MRPTDLTSNPADDFGLVQPTLPKLLAVNLVTQHSLFLDLMETSRLTVGLGGPLLVASMKIYRAAGLNVLSSFRSFSYSESRISERIKLLQADVWSCRGRSPYEVVEGWMRHLITLCCFIAAYVPCITTCSAYHDRGLERAAARVEQASEKYYCMFRHTS